MFAEQLDGYFNEFATEAIYNAQTIKVIFDEAYQEALGISATGPMITAKSADFIGARRGQNVVINSTTYKIAQPPRPDGTGMVQIDLEKQ